MENNVHIPTVKIIYWEHSCPDGCCFSSGYKLLVDDKVVVKNIDDISHGEFVSLILTYFDIKHNIYGDIY